VTVAVGRNFGEVQKISKFDERRINHRTVFFAKQKATYSARGTRARVSVNFRNFSPCIARARRARAGLTVYPPSRTLEPLPR
jgi:hypothetical protein